MELFFAQLIHTWSLLFVVWSMFVSFLPPHLPLHPCSLSLFIKVVIIFQAAFTGALGSGGVRSMVELAATLTVSINHLTRDSAPFISPHTLLLVYLPGLFISLFLWKIALFCFSAAHPPACIWHLCVCICVLVVGPSTCVALNLWPQILRRLTAAKYREREWGSTRE